MTSTVSLDAIDGALIERLHAGAPLCDQPFEAVGSELGLLEDEVIDRLQRLLAQGALVRLGPLYDIELAGGRCVLAALAVPQQRFDEVAALVNAVDAVTHSRRSEHALNLWFVVSADSPAEADATLARIGALSGLEVHAFTQEREYLVGLQLPAPSGRRGDAG